MSTYCAVADVQNLFAGANFNVTTSQITALIPLASAWVENYTQRIFASATYTEVDSLKVDRWQRIVGRTRQWPITNIAYLDVLLDGENVPIVLNLAYVNWTKPPQRLFWYSGPLVLPTNLQVNEGLGTITRGTPGIIDFTYTAGYTVIPTDISLATAMYAQFLIGLNANPLGAASISSGGSGGSTSLSLPQSGSLWVDQASQILDKWKRIDGGEG